MGVREGLEVVVAVGVGLRLGEGLDVGEGDKVGMIASAKVVVGEGVNETSDLLASKPINCQAAKAMAKAIASIKAMRLNQRRRRLRDEVCLGGGDSSIWLPVWSPTSARVWARASPVWKRCERSRRRGWCLRQAVSARSQPCC